MKILNPERPLRLAFVAPRSGAEIVGGNESLVLAIAARLRADGHSVEILTTCARDNRTWDNYYPPGVAEVNGVPVRRFLVSPRDLAQWIPLQIRLSEGGTLTTAEQLTWLEHGVNSHDLYSYLAANQTSFDLIVFTPYLFPVSIWGAFIAAERAVLLPCLHDEAYAYVPVIRNMFAKVGRIICNAHAEGTLAQRLYGYSCRGGQLQGGVVGMGFDLEPLPAKPSGGESLPYPYILYLGRKETGKGAHRLIDHFVAAKSHFAALGDPLWNELRLVIAGGGSFADLLRPDAEGRSDIVDIAAMSESEKSALLAGAVALINPSRNESFSIVLMEAWGVGTPVVVDARCEVTRDHVDMSNGGLYYRDEREFALVVDTLLRDTALARRLGESGYSYVAREYNWDAVMERWYGVIAKFLDGAPEVVATERDGEAHA